MNTNCLRRVVSLVALVVILEASARAQVVVEPYNESYQLTDLGPAPGVPPRYGGLTIKADDPNILLIGGDANLEAGAIYAVQVVRDTNDHIIGFQGTASVFVAAPYNDGGVVYGPGNVLFLARWPVNELGQVRPGSVAADKVINLSNLEMVSSVSGLNFVPGGFPSAGRLKLVTWPGGQFYDATVAPDGAGTFNLMDVTHEVTVPGGPEGLIYVPPGSPLFTAYRSMLVSAYSANTVDAYEIDERGAPVIETRQTFISGLNGAEGAAVDPLTGDFLFSTFGNANQVIVVSGFNRPPAANLVLSMEADKQALLVGDEVTSLVTVTNAGPEVATGVLVGVSLPAAASQVIVAVSRGEVQATDAFVNWNIGELGLGEGGTLSIRFVPLAGGEGVSSAVATLNEVDSQPGNNSASVMMTFVATRLAIRPGNDGAAVVFWHSLLEDYVLESALSITPPPETWDPVVLPVGEEGPFLRVMIPPPLPHVQQFFRLRKNPVPIDSAGAQ